MKPKALGVLVLLTLAIAHFGNGCAPSFKVLEDATNNSAKSCLYDESSLASLDQDWRVGYMDDREVLYHLRPDGWIQVEGDKLYPAKGYLPRKPVPKGISYGVGVKPADRWPNGRIPYVVHSALPNQARVSDAVAHWNTNLDGVIQFVPRTTESDYVLFRQSSNGCSAPVGYFQGEGVHPVELANECGSGNTAHEMGHIVGLDHEQNRHDRNSHVTINWGKIMSGYDRNFEVSNFHQDYSTYDFGSIMHYALSAFSTDGTNTITPKVSVPAGTLIGQRSGLSRGDIQSVRLMYGADIDDGGGEEPAPGDGTQGLFGQYFDGIDFKNLKRERVDSQVAFDWARSSPASSVGADYFSVRWKGWIKPAASGSYVLKVAGQDGYRIVIEGSTIVDSLSSTGYTSVQSNTLQLWKDQRYYVTIEFVARAGNASFRLAWSKDGATEVVIPSAQLVPDKQSDFPSNACTSL